MSPKRLLQLGGGINFLFVLFHLAFWKLFDWPHSLASLSPDDQATMQVLNVHTAYTLLVFVVLSLLFPQELMMTKLGRSIGIAIAAFWILRALNQAIFWDIASVGSWVIMAVCLVVAALYLVPVIKSPQPDPSSSVQVKPS